MLEIIVPKLREGTEILGSGQVMYEIFKTFFGFNWTQILNFIEILILLTALTLHINSVYSAVPDNIYSNKTYF
jgi:hypothetical protein